MPIALHYGLTVLIWGLTWTAIRLQVETAAVDLAVFYRFVMASVVALGVLALLRRLPRLSLRQHGWLVLQGLTLYSINFLLIYRAAETMTSGLLAVVFSLAALFNAFNGWVILRLRPTRRLYPAVALGVTGVALLFWHDLSLGNATLSSLLFAMAGTFWFSLGNLISVKVRMAEVPLLPGNAWAMVYGAVFLGGWCLVQGVEWVVPTSTTFWGATAFLAIPGSIVAFYCYITVIQTLGADKAGYATVLFPVVALSVSTWLEGFEWTTPAIAGAALALLGNWVLFRKSP
ncbi:MAG: DMT family transporter [Pseudomonadales bacterium]|uniref:DMT family transporter n=1 Tax=Marinobacter xestospongiae TaxID=994319 RepID=UPI00200346B0|nr:DMT family transporter [Marinobacter xestospongiae]MCG8519340.1 DMT family transporter [Pseudomonadales bacterium]MCK7566270.1 DMT family transporter [Marinobacter xestospongiae]